MTSLLFLEPIGWLCDLDGNYQPAKVERLAGLAVRKCIVVNQGGPACRAAGWGKHYPTMRSVSRNFLRLATAIGSTLYICWVYERNGIVLHAPMRECDWGHDLAWRMPNPGMLQAAMSDYQANPADCLLLAESTDGRGAAQAASIAHLRPTDFFTPQQLSLGVL